ncbi:hypothetical protein ACK2FS_01615 [Clostridioides difficile]
MKNSFVYGTGIQINGNESHDATHLKGKWYVDSKKGIDSFYVDINKGKELTQDKMRRPKANQQEIFIPPYVLLKKELTRKHIDIEQHFQMMHLYIQMQLQEYVEKR